MTRPVSPQAGFTLAETLVALFILAIVSSAGAALLIGATTTSQQIRDQEQITRQLDVAQRLIRQDIMAMDTRAVRSTDGFSGAINLYGEKPRGEAPFLTFVRSGWLNPGYVEPRSGLQSVAYALRDGDLIREASLRPDATSGTPVSSRVLLNNVRTVELGFQRGDQVSEFWNGDSELTRSLLPDLIKMTILFEDGTQLTLAALTGGQA
ncbi:MAG: type II secretion system minor pseudopilin GspJ [Henriciella sp.]|nr:type II secretion system minor pseudopilin GspJ [Henriciella sp.]